MSRTTFRSQVLFMCHSRAKRRIPVPLLSPRLFPSLEGRGYYQQSGSPSHYGKGLGVRFFGAFARFGSLTRPFARSMSQIIVSRMPKPLISQDVAARVPPGQILTDKFPVLTYGPTPRFDPKTWDFKVVGLVEKPLRFSYEEFRALPQSREVADFHCVTTWSRLDNTWEGVKVADLMKLVKLSPEVRHVIVHCDGDYTTNLPLNEFLDDDVMLAHRHDGRDLEPDHGFPLRLIVPKLYGWKSAKWVRAIEFTDIDRRGFWEVRGYHNHADPWTAEGYSLQEDPED